MRWEFQRGILVLFFLILAATACRKQGTSSNEKFMGTVSPEFGTLPPPEWADNAVLYEVNIRQYTPEGNFAAFSRHLSRLKEMGIDILWLMPIHPVSQVKRKGSLGSPYAVADYQAVNPDFGTLEEFKQLVQAIHALGMKVILDWVPNHTGWDHRWIKERPEWYSHDLQADTIVHPKDKGKVTDWHDVAELDFGNPELKKALIEAMVFWLREADIDGFRFDTAHNQPLEFWEEASGALRREKPDIFLLGETEDERYRNKGYFDVTYSWTFHHLMNKIAGKEENAAAIEPWLQQNAQRFTRGYNLQFITNHDENSWKGTVRERMGEAGEAMAVLAFTFDGMPLIYGGQEAGVNAGLTKRLMFFEKDTIDWNDFAGQVFFTQLINLKHRNKALWNGNAGGRPVIIRTEKESKVFAFYREKDGDKVLVVLNLSSATQDVTLKDGEYAGDYANIFAHSTTTVTKNMTLRLNPWDYLVLSNK
jgi:alpha-amylase